MPAEPEPSADPDLFAQLVQAYLDCRRTKRNSASALAFEARLEHNLIAAARAAHQRHLAPGRSICFVVTKPKPREVWAADLPRPCGAPPALQPHRAALPRALHGSTAAPASQAAAPVRRPPAGAPGAQRHRQLGQRPAHYLKCDLANFFVSINKHVLLAQLQRHVTEPWWLRLATTVLMHDPRQDVEVRGTPAERLALVPPHKRLFNAPADKGLPIGNLSSQFFANVLLNDLDQRVKHQHRAPHYVRYVDDFVLVHPSVAYLQACWPTWPPGCPASCTCSSTRAKPCCSPWTAASPSSAM
jgi:RNA-directed DNA polymerase